MTTSGTRCAPTAHAHDWRGEGDHRGSIDETGSGVIASLRSQQLPATAVLQPGDNKKRRDSFHSIPIDLKFLRLGTDEGAWRVDRDMAIEKQGDALQRMLLALAAMTGLLDAARLPRDIYLALFRPLSAAHEAAAQVSPPAHRDDPVAVARLRRRVLLLCRAIDGLRRRLTVPARRSAVAPDRKVRGSRIERRSRAPRAVPVTDTS